LLLFKGVLLTTVLLGIYNFYFLQQHAPSLAFEATTVWLILAFYLTIGKTNQRCTLLDLTLPIPARKLWLSHFLSLIAAGAVTLAASAGILIGGIRLITRLSGRPAYSAGDLLSATPQIVACLILAAAVLQSLHPSLYAIPGTARNRLVKAVSLAGILLLLLLIIPHSPLLMLLPLLAGLILAYWNYRSIPAAYSVFPLQANGAGPAAEDARPETYGTRAAADAYADGRPLKRFEHKRLLFTTMFRCFMKVEGLIKIPGIGFMIMTFLFLWGVVLSGFLSVWRGWEEDLRSTFVFLTAYILFSGLRAQMKQMLLLDPFPIPRKTIFAVLILPLLFTVMLGYGAGHIGIALMQKNTEAVDFLDCRGTYCIRVPSDFYRIAWNGRIPRNTSPWGESHDAWSWSLFSGGSPAIYSPFSVPKECSADFAALQISRAVETVYGRSIPPNEIKNKYFVVEADTIIGLKEPGFTLQKDHPDLRRRSGGPFFPVFFMLSGLAWMLMVSIYMRTFRAGIQEGIRIAVFILLMVISFTLHFVPYAGAIGGFMSLDAMIGFFHVTIRSVTEALPGGSVSVWVICTVLFYAGYRLARLQFERAEIPYRREANNG